MVEVLGLMVSVKDNEFMDNFEEWCNKAVSGETIIISNQKNENVVVLSEREYNNLIKFM